MQYQITIRNEFLVSLMFQKHGIGLFPCCHDNPATTRVTARRQWICGGRWQLPIESVQLLRIAERRVLVPRQKTGVLVMCGAVRVKNNSATKPPCFRNGCRLVDLIYEMDSSLPMAVNMWMPLETTVFTSMAFSNPSNILAHPISRSR